MRAIFYEVDEENDMKLVEALLSVLYGMVEGITEWLPISSTGHLILLDAFCPLPVSDSFLEMFLVVIQLGAILAVPVLYGKRLWPFGKSKSESERKRTWGLLAKVLVGMLPAALIGIPFDDVLDAYLRGPIIVAVALIVYGFAFLLIEGRKRNGFRIQDAEDITYKDALLIGCFQVLSLIPGTSRSGSTILGAMLLGVSRTAGAEFSFFMAIPVMLGASFIKILKFILDGYRATMGEIFILGFGCVSAFFVSILAIRFLTDFVKRHSFKPFAFYRIALGVLVLVLALAGLVA